MAETGIQSEDEVFLDVDNRRFALATNVDGSLEFRVYICGKLQIVTSMTHSVAALLGAMLFTKAASK